MESRCGIRCTQCEYREKMGCAGCTEIERPFWGERCPVKHCAEEKGHAHCGRCAEFPCALLHGFAYDPEQGDDGARIRQCEIWSREEAKQ